jgi:hypothetical protein
MFPSASKDNKILLPTYLSPKEQRDSNKSTYLPYFKRFPNHKFLSQERKRPLADSKTPHR